MITLNVWKHEPSLFFKNAYPASHPIMGPLFSNFLGKNVGHVNLVFEIYESSINLEEVKQSYPNVPFEWISSYEKEKTGEDCYKRGKKLEGLRATLSTWGAVNTNILQDIAMELKIKKGSKIFFQKQEEDMLSESNFGEAEHIYHINKFIKNKKEQLSHLKFSLEKTQFDFNFLKEKLHNLEREIDESKYILKTTPDHEKLMDELSAKYYKQATLKKLINYTNKKIETIKKNIELASFEIMERSETKGKRPDLIINLPSQYQENNFYLDEKKILKEIERQHSGEACFTILSHNCSVNVKKCLLSGVSPTLKQKMMQMGIDENFFKLQKIETPLKVAKWANTLSEYLSYLNKHASRITFS